MSHVSLVTLGVRDLAAATAFYQALGWRLSTSSVEGTVAFFDGTPVLALFGSHDLAADADLPVAEAAASTRFALAMNVASDADVDQILVGARRAGGTVPKPGQRTEWGGYSGYFLDLDEHLWEVAHNPHWRLDGEGRITLPG